jgi:alginate O-acetyltransferase complex protein AlgI
VLFNSHIFIFLFLPAVLVGYYGLARLAVSDRLPLLWLLAVSLFFYGWWEERYLILLVTSISINFFIGRLIVRSTPGRFWLGVGIAFNLSLLAYFKYAFFIVENLGGVLGRSWTIDEITLPLAISFFTFQQIAWLVDVSRARTKMPTFFNYALFVTFFPQLIAGPIVHHAEMMPQFENASTKSRVKSNINIGITLFTLGLFKKVVLADQFALYSNPVFDAAARGEVLTMLEAWVGTFSYTFQLYFDFSGYSDMAVGLARLFGIVLPINFFSPYKAVNIQAFWQRWHITLSRFLRDYLYIPLGGNRAGTARVSANILLTMLIGGLWHGAAWTFVAWGGLHGFFLLIHRWYAGRYTRDQLPTVMARRTGVLCTFLSVALAWVLFRAETFSAAVVMYKGLFGFTGVGAANLPYFQGLPELVWLAVGCMICFIAPNAYQFLADRQPALIPVNVELVQSRVRWQGSIGWAVVFAGLFTWSVLAMNRISEFLYFQF